MNQPLMRILAMGLLTVAAFWLADSVNVRAQDEGVEVEAVDENAGGQVERKEVVSDNSLGGMIIDSGIVGIAFYLVLGLFSLFALTIALERIFNLKRGKIIPPAFEASLRELVNRGGAEVEEYRRLCGTSNSAIANVLSSAAKRAGRPLPEVEKAMEDTVAREMATLRGKHRPLSVIGNVAPLVGLLGTVVGIIFAFKTASVEGVGKGEALSEGISLALMTTAVGLTIAIPSLILAAWFNAKCERYMREVDERLLDTLPSFSRWEHQEVSDYAVNRQQRAEEPVGAS